MQLPKFISPYWAILGAPIAWLGEHAWSDLWGTGGMPIKVPYLWLFIVSLAVVAGALWADARNPKSALRTWVAERQKSFDVLACFVGQEAVPHEFFSIQCLMKFCKNVKDVDLVVRVSHLRQRGNSVTVVHSEKVTAHKDEEKRLRLVNIPITRLGDAFARHAIWGGMLGDKDLKSGQHSFIGGPTVVDVCVGRQKYRVFVGQAPLTIDLPAPVFVVTEADFQSIDAA